MSGSLTGLASAMSRPSTPLPVGRSPIAAWVRGSMPCVMNSTSLRSFPTTPRAPYFAPAECYANHFIGLLQRRDFARLAADHYGFSEFGTKAGQAATVAYLA